MRINDVLIKEAGIVDTLKAVFKSDPLTASLPLSQRISALERNTAIKNLASQAYKKFQSDILTAQQANVAAGQPSGVSDQEYLRKLSQLGNSLLGKNLKQDPDIESDEMQRILDMEISIVQNRNNGRRVQDLFVDYVTVLAAAKSTPSTKKPASGAPASAPTGAINTQQAKTAVDQFMQGGIGTRQEQAIVSFLNSTAGTNTVRSTGNPVTDAFLNRLGIKTQ